MRIALLACMVAAAPALAQAPAASDKEPRQPLNLRLDDAMRSQPVINFGPAPAAKEPGSALPSLGSEARKVEPAPAQSESRRPYPKDSEMR